MNHVPISSLENKFSSIYQLLLSRRFLLHGAFALTAQFFPHAASLVWKFSLWIIWEMLLT
jgi:hypothetical protein